MVTRVGLGEGNVRLLSKSRRYDHVGDQGLLQQSQKLEDSYMSHRVQLRVVKTTVILGKVETTNGFQCRPLCGTWKKTPKTNESARAPLVLELYLDFEKLAVPPAVILRISSASRKGVKTEKLHDLLPLCFSLKIRLRSYSTLEVKYLGVRLQYSRKGWKGRWVLLLVMYQKDSA